MSRLVSTFQGKKIYLDTMIFHLLLRTQNVEIERLLERIESGEVQAYTSVLTFDELTYRMLLALIRDKYSGFPLDNLRQRQTELIGELCPQLMPKLAELQQFPNLAVQEVTAADLLAMHTNMTQFHLLPRDALHLTAMQKVQCFDLVSQDSDFDLIPWLRRYTVE
jgi:predicted nucleic acid-binding protein